MTKNLTKCSETKKTNNKQRFKHKNLDIRIKIGVSVLVGICVFLLARSDIEFINNFNIRVSDTIYQARSVSVLPITIVRIDEKTIDALGQPQEWSRQVYADLIEKLDGSGNAPSVIAFDILFSGYKDEAGDTALADAAAKYGNIIAGIKANYSEKGSGRNKLSITDLVAHIDSVSLPYDELKNVVDLGLVNCQPDQYDYITTTITGTWFEGKWYDSLAISTLKKFAENTANDEEYSSFHPDYANLVLPDYSNEENNIYRFSFFEAQGGFGWVSLIDILTGEVDPRSFENNIMLVGCYASGFGDDFSVLITGDNGESRMYGVEIHANIMEATFADRYQTDANKTLMAVIYGLISAGLAFAMLSVTIIKGILISLGTLILHLIVSLILYNNGIYIMLVHMIFACIMLVIGIVVFHYISVRAERVKINNAFRMYVAPEIVDDVAESGSYELHLGGRNKDIAVLFVDIRGFTTMSENLAPEEVVEILNEYFGVITDAIFKNKGTLDKFIGDAAMAVFNSPFDLDDYVYRAVATACDIAKASEALGEKLMERFGKKVSYGIGVNCGQAIIGNIGSNFRMDYTAIGDTVNTASRLESNAKAGEILISEEVKKRLEGRIETEDVGEIPLKGKSNKIFVYRVKHLKENDDNVKR